MLNLALHICFVTSEILNVLMIKPSGISLFSKEKNEIDVSWQELSERDFPRPSLFIYYAENSTGKWDT